MALTTGNYLSARRARGPRFVSRDRVSRRVPRRQLVNPPLHEQLASGSQRSPSSCAALRVRVDGEPSCAVVLDRVAQRPLFWSASRSFHSASRGPSSGGGAVGGVVEAA